jgi:uncharacterized protein (DUF2252 family)
MVRTPTGDRGAPQTAGQRRAAGRAVRGRLPRARLARLTTGGRDPLGILAAQDATRVPDLVPLRAERMAASPFAFYRGTAALMAADLGRDEHTGICVASCGDAHVANFGLYASPQRRLVFDLNDFDEAAWAPWEWDVKRLVTSLVVGGREAGHDEATVREVALAAVHAYVRALDAVTSLSPVERYFSHFDARAVLANERGPARTALKAAIRDAERRTGERAVRRLTQTDADGRMAFVEAPPTTAHVAAGPERDVHEDFAAYAETVAVDVRLLLRQHTVADVVRRVVGVGSVGTRCYLVLLQDGDGNALILQVKEAGRSVLAQHGGARQPEALVEHVAAFGEGGRVVALQRVLQAFSDPFLGHLHTEHGDFYVRQFHDMKGGFDVATLDGPQLHRYGRACAVVLARAHGQSPDAAAVVGYAGGGKAVGEAILDWAYAYADLSRTDYERFVAARATTAPEA